MLKCIDCQLECESVQYRSHMNRRDRPFSMNAPRCGECFAKLLDVRRDRAIKQFEARSGMSTAQSYLNAQADHEVARTLFLLSRGLPLQSVCV